MFFVLISFLCIFHAGMSSGSAGIAVPADDGYHCLASHRVQEFLAANSIAQVHENQIDVRNITRPLSLSSSIQNIEGRKFISSFESNAIVKPVLFIIDQQKTSEFIIQKPVGLFNPKNRCYLNATMQLFRPLQPELESLPRGASTSSEIVSAFRDTLNAMVLADLAATRPHNATSFKDKVDKAVLRCDDENKDDQQDANELLTRFLPDHLFDAYKDPKASKEHITGLEALFKITTRKTEFYEGKEKEEIEGGKYSWVDLELTDMGPPDSLDDALAHCFGGIHSKPDVRRPEGIVTLKQQEYVAETGRFALFTMKRNLYGRRNENPTPFPLVGLNLAKYRKDPDGPPLYYELEGVIMHSGSHKSGHYVAYIRKVANGNVQWFLCDDDKVTPISDYEMTSIAYRGYGQDKSFLPTTFLYKQVDANTYDEPRQSNPPDDAVLVLAYAKDGTSHVIVEKNEKASIANKEVAQSLRSLIQERAPSKAKKISASINRGATNIWRWVQSHRAMLMVGLACIIGSAAFAYQKRKEDKKMRDKQQANSGDKHSNKEKMLPKKIEVN